MFSFNRYPLQQIDINTIVAQIVVTSLVMVCGAITQLYKPTIFNTQFYEHEGDNNLSCRYNCMTTCDDLLNAQSACAIRSVNINIAL